MLSLCAGGVTAWREEREVYGCYERWTLRQSIKPFDLLWVTVLLATLLALHGASAWMVSLLPDSRELGRVLRRKPRAFRILMAFFDAMLLLCEMNWGLKLVRGGKGGRRTDMVAFLRLHLL